MSQLVLEIATSRQEIHQLFCQRIGKWMTKPFVKLKLGLDKSLQV
jgi:hypothetical protein